jgi:dTDP-4-amino-4,6-dideoxygalactose transaminase
MIRFNHPFLFGPELEFVKEAIDRGRLAGNGDFTKKCHQFFRERFGFEKCLLTTSCTDALEMSAILLDLKEGDEVIVPAYTFVSSANAFVLRGARIVFADSHPDHPNIDESKIESLITERTKAIVVVHYGGAACEMDTIMAIADRHHIAVIEDAAQAIDAYYRDKPLGSIGHLAAFSFHETKNVVSGEGGMLVVNHERYRSRAEIIWEKGTNRTAFFRGEVDKYGWVDVGSSFLPSDVIAAYLYGQLLHLECITSERTGRWMNYYAGLATLESNGRLKRPHLPSYASNNGHVFYIQCKDLSERSALIDHLKAKSIGAVFHYLSLHKSPFFHAKHDGRVLPYADLFADTLLRLPLHLHLTPADQQVILDAITEFYSSKY